MTSRRKYGQPGRSVQRGPWSGVANPAPPVLRRGRAPEACAAGPGPESVGVSNPARALDGEESFDPVGVGQPDAEPQVQHREQPAEGADAELAHRRGHRRPRDRHGRHHRHVPPAARTHGVLQRRGRHVAHLRPADLAGGEREGHAAPARRGTRPGSDRLAAAHTTSWGPARRGGADVGVGAEPHALLVGDGGAGPAAPFEHVGGLQALLVERVHRPGVGVGYAPEHGQADQHRQPAHPVGEAAPGRGRSRPAGRRGRWPSPSAAGRRRRGPGHDEARRPAQRAARVAALRRATLQVRAHGGGGGDGEAERAGQHVGPTGAAARSGREVPAPTRLPSQASAGARRRRRPGARRAGGRRRRRSRRAAGGGARRASARPVATGGRGRAWRRPAQGPPAGRPSSARRAAAAGPPSPRGGGARAGAAARAGRSAPRGWQARHRPASRSSTDRHDLAVVVEAEGRLPADLHRVAPVVVEPFATSCVVRRQPWLAHHARRPSCTVTTPVRVWTTGSRAVVAATSRPSSRTGSSSQVTDRPSTTVTISPPAARGPAAVGAGSAGERCRAGGGGWAGGGRRPVTVTNGSRARSSGCSASADMSQPAGRATANSSSQMSTRFTPTPPSRRARPATSVRRSGAR